LFVIADRLKKTVGQVEAMPYDEFVEWVAYFKTVDVKGLE